MGVGGKERGNFRVESFTAWGSHVQGRCGSVAVDVSKRIDIALVLLHSAAFPKMEKSLLEHLLSLLTHPFTHRRLCLSMLHRPHKWMKELRYGATAEWPADIRDEIIACALACCVAESNIRWNTFQPPTRLATTAGRLTLL